MAGRYSSRNVDTEPGWARRRFREQQEQIDALRVGKVSAVPGAAVTITQVLAGASGILQFVNTDTATAVGSGDLTIDLTYLPIAGSLHVYWNGVAQPPTGWTRTGLTLVLADPDSLIAAGDVVTCAYAVDRSVTTPVQESGVLADWGAGFRWLQVDQSDGTDRSAIAYDDSSWTTSAGAVGHPVGAHPDQPSWPVVATDTASSAVGLWGRVPLDIAASCTLSVSARVDGEWWLYCDGVLLDSGANTDTGVEEAEEVGPYEVAVTTGAHVVALRVRDDDGDLTSDILYADVMVEVV